MHVYTRSAIPSNNLKLDLFPSRLRKKSSVCRWVELFLTITSPCPLCFHDLAGCQHLQCSPSCPPSPPPPIPTPHLPPQTRLVPPLQFPLPSYIIFSRFLFSKSLTTLKKFKIDEAKVCVCRSVCLSICLSRSPWYDLRGWLGVEQQLSICLSQTIPRKLLMSSSSSNLARWLLSQTWECITCSLYWPWPSFKSVYNLFLVR